jgi:hypothetical protein
MNGTVVPPNVSRVSPNHRMYKRAYAGFRSQTRPVADAAKVRAFATGRDCSAPNPKPKRSAVRGRAVSRCFARRRLAPTAINKRGRDWTLPLIAAHCRIQMRHRMKYSISFIFQSHALPLALVRNILSHDSVAFQPILSRVRAENPPRFNRGCDNHPPRFGCVRNLSIIIPLLIRVLIDVLYSTVRSSEWESECLRLKGLSVTAKAPSRCPKSRWLSAGKFRVCRRIPASSVFLFASRVVFRASSEMAPEPFSRVVLSGAAGQVSELMSSRAGRAHRDCLPLGTAPKQPLSSPSVAARRASLAGSFVSAFACHSLAVSARRASGRCFLSRTVQKLN